MTEETPFGQEMQDGSAPASRSNAPSAASANNNTAEYKFSWGPCKGLTLSAARDPDVWTTLGLSGSFDSFIKNSFFNGHLKNRPELVKSFQRAGSLGIPGGPWGVPGESPGASLGISWGSLGRSSLRPPVHPLSRGGYLGSTPVC